MKILTIKSPPSPPNSVSSNYKTKNFKDNFNNINHPSVKWKSSNLSTSINHNPNPHSTKTPSNHKKANLINSVSKTPLSKSSAKNSKKELSTSQEQKKILNT